MTPKEYIGRELLKSTVSGIVLILLLIGMLSLTFNIQPVKADWTWTETIYIRADGSVEPDTAPISSVDNTTYILTDNIVGDVPEYSNAIVIERDNIILDGEGYTLGGTENYDSRGIDLSGRSNVTIKDTEITSFWGGIRLSSSLNNSISGSNIKANFDHGILLVESSNNRISCNNITNSYDGIVLDNSCNNRISCNNIKANFDDGILLVESSNNRISGNNITNNGSGISLSASNNAISGNNITNNGYGVWLSSSSNNTVYGNNIRNNTHGVRTWESSYNTVYGNNITNSLHGVYLWFDFNNTLSGNIIRNNDDAIFLIRSNSNRICDNHMTENGDGIILGESSNNIIYGNNITNHPRAMLFFTFSSNNTIYHNSFVNNTAQVALNDAGPNTWDNGYPSGGNYWSDHYCTGNPNNGSQPYIIDADNVDHYPFQDPNGWVVLGDVNDDGIINILDILLCAVSFGSQPGDSNWNPIVDLDQNGIINILDILKIAVHFGEIV